MASTFGKFFGWMAAAALLLLGLFGMTAVYDHLLSRAHDQGLASSLELVNWPCLASVLVAIDVVAAVAIMIFVPSNLFGKRVCFSMVSVAAAWTALSVSLYKYGSNYYIASHFPMTSFFVPADMFKSGLFSTGDNENVMVMQCGRSLVNDEGRQTQRTSFYATASGAKLTILGRSETPSYRYLVQVDHPETKCLESEFLVDGISLGRLERRVAASILRVPPAEDSLPSLRHELGAVHGIQSPALH